MGTSYFWHIPLEKHSISKVISDRLHEHVSMSGYIVFVCTWESCTSCVKDTKSWTKLPTGLKTIMNPFAICKWDKKWGIVKLDFFLFYLNMLTHKISKFICNNSPWIQQIHSQMLFIWSHVSILQYLAKATLWWQWKVWVMSGFRAIGQRVSSGSPVVVSRVGGGVRARAPCQQVLENHGQGAII